MQNQEIVKIIENLKGRRNYEEKKASKLGFSSLHAYIENKLLKEKEAAKAETIKQSVVKKGMVEEKKPEKKKSCSCC